jgi:hypothetical protein
MSKTFVYDRFDCTNGGSAHCYGCYTMDASSDGDYVRAEDAINREAVLQAEIRTLQVQLKDARAIDANFKNFHRQLCERFGYVHDEKDWKRDQVSLIEWIAKQEPSAAKVSDEQIRMAMILTPAYCDDGDYQHWIRMGRSVLALAASPKERV